MAAVQTKAAIKSDCNLHMWQGVPFPASEAEATTPLHALTLIAERLDQCQSCITASTPLHALLSVPVARQLGNVLVGCWSLRLLYGCSAK